MPAPIRRVMKKWKLLILDHTEHVLTEEELSGTDETIGELAAHRFQELKDVMPRAEDYTLIPL